jgi:uncharacterized protein
MTASEYSESHNLLRTIQYMGGKKHGSCIRYLPDGNKSEEHIYSNGVLTRHINYCHDVITSITDYNGVYKKKEVRYINGVIYTDSNYGDKGKLEGKRIFYYDDAAVHEMGFYENGLLEGLFEVYFRSGQIKERSTYVKGGLHGICTMYSEDGAIVEQYHAANDRLEGPCEIYSGGRLVSRRNFRKSAPHGVHEFYYCKGSATGQLKEKCYYEYGLRQGEQLVFFENGRPSKIEEYEDDVLKYWKHFDHDGHLVEEKKRMNKSAR